MNKEQRQLLIDRATLMHNAYQRMGDHVGQRICEVAIAALRYADSFHIADSNHSAHDCDSCSARHALEELEKLLGGPQTFKGIGG
jgi:hypothetical protein